MFATLRELVDGSAAKSIAITFYWNLALTTSLLPKGLNLSSCQFPEYWPRWVWTLPEEASPGLDEYTIKLNNGESIIPHTFMHAGYFNLAFSRSVVIDNWIMLLANKWWPADCYPIFSNELPMISLNSSYSNGLNLQAIKQTPIQYALSSSVNRSSMGPLMLLIYETWWPFSNHSSQSRLAYPWESCLWPVSFSKSGAPFIVSLGLVLWILIIFHRTDEGQKLK